MVAFFDGLAHLQQGFFQHRVAGGLGGNGQSLQDGHTRRDQRTQGAGKAAYCDLPQQRADNGKLEQHFVEVIAPARMLTDLFDPDHQPDRDYQNQPPESLHERAQSHDDAGRKRKGDTQSRKQVGKDRHDPLQQGADDQHRNRYHGDGVNQR